MTYLESFNVLFKIFPTYICSCLEPVYNTLYESSTSFVNGESTCRDGEEHAQRTYSTLEDEINYKGGKDEDGGDHNPERVYSVIEDDSLHYLTILPDESP